MKNKKLLLVLSSFLLLGCNMGGSSISSEDLLSSEESGEIVSNESSPSSEENLSITGNGTKADPFKIYTVDNFVEFASSYNSSNEVVYYELANDIDLANVELAPIGTEEKPFVGAFNGAGKKISNFKLTNYSKSIGNYGLFGYVSNSYFHDLSLSVDIDLTVLGAKTSVSIGGLIGFASNTPLYNVKVDGDISVVSGQNSNSSLVLGGVIGTGVASSNYYVDARKVESRVNISANLEDAADTTNIAAGIIGTISTGYGEGAYSVNTSLYEGEIVAEDAVGGIAGVCTYFVSILDCYVSSAKLLATSDEASYVGGIIAQSYYETAFLNNLIVVDEMISTPSNDLAFYDSMVGAVAGYVYKDVYDEGVDMLGATLYKNYYKVGNMTSDIVDESGTSVSEISESLIKNDLELSSSWSYANNELRLIDSDVESVSITLKANYEGASEDEVITSELGSYDSVAIGKINNATLSRENHSFNGYYYDENKEAPYCFYAPFLKDTSLYAGWTDLSSFIGTYEYVNDFGTSGTWKFTEDTFYWVYDMETFVYSYTLRDNYILIGEGTGGYVGEIFIINENGTITGYDVNDYSYAYTGTKTNKDLEIVNYEGNAVLGTWYSTNGAIFELFANGNLSAISTTSNVAYSGGFRLNGTTFKISSWGRITGTFTYDEENQVMYNETMFISRNPVDEKYTSSDSKLAIYIVGEDTYIIYNGSLSSSTYTGELVDGGSIEFDGVTYDVNGSSLLPKSQTPDVDNPSTGEDEEEKEDKPTEFSLYGTWKDGNGNVVIFNDDGTGSWDGYEFTYDEDTGVISSISGTAFVSEYNEFKVNDNGTLEIFVSDEYYDDCYRGTFSKVESNGQNIYGTYRDGNTNTLVLNNDGTGTWNGYEFTYNEETGAMSSFGAFDSDKNKITVNDNGTLTVFVSDSYDDNFYTGTFVKQ